MSIITNIQTIRLKNIPNITFVEIETDEGLVGLGEVWRGSGSVETIIHDEIAPWLVGQDSRRIEFISQTLMTPYLGFHSSGAEVRAASAVDIALWDLQGKRHNVPVYELLGGAFRDELPVYNTCSGYVFNASASSFNSNTGRRSVGDDDVMQGPYDDQVAFMQDAGALAKSLLAEGYKAMKIWPFDPYAAKSNGTYISQEDLLEGLAPFKKIREAVGNKIEVMCELHSLWNLPSAIKICQALEQYDILWAEDPLCKMDNIQALQELRSKTRVPICGSETLATAPVFRQMLAAGTFDYCMFDLGWCGGMTEARKIANLAESHGLPVAPHDCTGPVSLWAGLQLSFYSSNALFQEVVRANLATWYLDLADELPVIKDGKAQRPTRAGLGVALKPEVKQREDAMIRSYKS